MIFFDYRDLPVSEKRGKRALFRQKVIQESFLNAVIRDSA
jgi:hypothetical protein